ncbi:MAG: TraB/GumN family protein [Myxococcota bacterium]|nr:TraB/GumN family protein [Deltaproteobacteria bacterium]MDQ3339466.1 TraB/GumN family protein [Myxococcota bacterium]
MTNPLRALIVFLVFTAACKSEPVKTIECPYYWSVEKDGKTTHLLGTIHGGVDAKQLPQHVWADLDRAPAVAIEADISDPSLMAKIQRTGPSLREELGDAYWKKLEKVVGAPTAKALTSLKTSMAAAVIMHQQMPRQVQTPMDLEVLTTAKRKNKRVVFLESIDDQLELLDKYITVRDVRNMLDDSGLLRSEMAAMVTAYEAGDEAALSSTIAKSRAQALTQGYTQAEVDEQYAALFDRRNQAWIMPLEQLHAAGGGFVAVGSGHLIGPESVTALLAKKGYTVQRTACAKR